MAFSVHKNVKDVPPRRTSLVFGLAGPFIDAFKFYQVQYIFIIQVNDERIKEMFAKNYKNHAAFAVLISVSE